MRLDTLNCEKVAYWYFRLNGFLQIENFVIHNQRGSQRTDADLFGVRFPFRAEMLYDPPHEPMADDEQTLALSRDLVDVVIVEVKTTQPCTLNGPWTEEGRQNVHRALVAIGCIPESKIGEAADNLYREGTYRCHDLRLRIRLVAVGRDFNADLAKAYPQVVQLVWPQLLCFIWDRFEHYRRQKTQVDQWEEDGRKLKLLADSSGQDDFVAQALRLMGVGAR
jgi:hypothetical protein